MGFLGDLVDDLADLPGKLVGGVLGMTSDAIAAALTLPVKVVDAALEAGCKTRDEIEAFARKWDL